MAIKVDTITAPSHWASALVNGDYSGLSDSEYEACVSLVNGLADMDIHVVDVVRDDSGEGSEPRFTWSYRLYGGDANGGEVLDYVTHEIVA